MLPKSWAISEKIVKRLSVHSGGRQRAIIEDGEILLVLHEPPEKDALERVVAYFWLDKEGAWHSGERGKGVQTLRNHVEKYQKILSNIDKEYEESKNPDNCFSLLEQLAPLLRASQNMYNAIQSTREFCKEENDIIGLRDTAYNINRNFELIYTDTKNKLDFYIAKQSELQASLAQESVDSSNRLNHLAAIFFPITALASIFGVNLRIGLEDKPYWPFVLMLVFGLMSGLILKNWVSFGRIKRRR